MVIQKLPVGDLVKNSLSPNTYVGSNPLPPNHTRNQSNNPKSYGRTTQRNSLLTKIVERWLWWRLSCKRRNFSLTESVEILNRLGFGDNEAIAILGMIAGGGE